MKHVPFLTLLASIALITAGCIGGEETPQVPDPNQVIPDDWYLYAIPDDPDHDHYDVKQHQGLSTPNFELLGYNPLESEHYGTTASGTLCGDAIDADGRRLAVVHSIVTDVAFFLIDVTDAANPVTLGEFVMPHTGSRDVALSVDGRHVLIATEGPDEEADDGLFPPPPDPPLSQRAYWRDACTGEVSPVQETLGVRAASQDDKAYPPGFLLVNVEDPAEIFVESVMAGPVLGGHSVTVSEVNGESLVIGSVTNLATPATYWYFMAIEDTAAGSQLVLLSAWDEAASTENAPVINGHNDGWAQVHPVTGRTIAYLAAWHDGVILLDITNPRAPMEIGRWSDSPVGNQDLVQDGTGNIHQAIPLEGTWDGKHYTFIGQEILAHPSNSPSGWVRVLDTTDPTNPTKLADWTLPTDIDWGGTGLVFSTHYLTLHEKTLFVAHYHAGVWAIDLSGLGTQPLLPTIGVFVPAEEPPNPFPEHRSYTWAPTIMEVDALDNGDLVVFDSWTGAYVVRFDASNPAPPAWPYTDF